MMALQQHVMGSNVDVRSFSKNGMSLTVKYSRNASMRGRCGVVVRASVEETSKSLEIMRKFSEQYAKRRVNWILNMYLSIYILLVYRERTVPSGSNYHSLAGNQLCLFCRSGTYFCMDKSVTAVVIKGLAEHKDELGAPLCPCRHYDDKQAEADQGFWNCPCVPMRERKVCTCLT
jgi:ferredoxin-thioredoxin reductase catalytic subunit